MEYNENIEFIMKFGKCDEEKAKYVLDIANGDVARAILLLND